MDNSSIEVVIGLMRTFETLSTIYADMAIQGQLTHADARNFQEIAGQIEEIFTNLISDPENQEHQQNIRQLQETFRNRRKELTSKLNPSEN